MYVSVSVIVFTSSVTSIWYFLIFYISLWKLSLCPSIHLLSSVSTFMITTLNSLSGKLLIFIPLRFLFVCLRFYLILSLEHICFFILLVPLSKHYMKEPRLPVLKCWLYTEGET